MKPEELDVIRLTEMKSEELEVIRLTEQNLLGSLLIAGSDGDTEPITAVGKIVKVADFLEDYIDQLHRRIFQAMLNGKTDLITVANAMNDTGTLKGGDISYMAFAIANAVSGLDCEHYAGLVADNAKRTGGRVKPRFTGVI